ncbi:MAG: DNA polymerase I [Clostridia bacterium]
MTKLIAIDGNSLMHRAYWALPSMTTKSGVPTGAVYGFISMLIKLLAYEPAYMVVAFDMHAPTFRHVQYAEYKAGRKPTPDELRAQFPIIKDLLRAMGIMVCECEGFEADDIIGTFASMANKGGVDALVVTGDRDALQLINDRTHVLLTKKGITETVEYDEAALYEQYGLLPDQMVDLKGLMGDTSDNLPGIPGVGEKTALKLLGKYGSMQGVLDNADRESGALKTRLMENGDSARMSYTLGRIDTGVNVAIRLEDCVFNKLQMGKCIPMMRELELRSLISRLPEAEIKIVEPADYAAAKTERIEDEASLAALCDKLKGSSRLALDFGETLLLATDERVQYEVVLGATLLDSGLDEERVVLALHDVFGNAEIAKLVFDAKRTMHLLDKYDTQLCGVTYDAMIVDYLLHATHPADSLKTLCAEHMGTAGGAAQLITLCRTELAELAEKGIMDLYRNVELPLVGVLFDMERTGFAVDMDILKGLGADFECRLAAIEKTIYETAGEQFNILSPKQLGVVLFEKLHLPPQRKTKSGYSTDAETLEALSEFHPVVPQVLEYRFLSKLKSTFIDGLYNIARDNRVHTSFNQNVTSTGRISSTEPNLQNIPVRTEQGREIRRAFVASRGNILVGADYSQIELRLLAHMSKDTRMIDAFISGDDIHARTAGEVFSTPLADVTKAQRSAAKAVNFGIVYGISDYGLARNLGITRKEAGEYIKLYLDRYTGVKAYMHSSVEDGRRNGYAKTLLGRRRELPEINSSNFNTRSFGERVAMNMPIQGTAADIIKLAMVRVHSRLNDEGLHAKLVLQIHDELIIDTPKNEEAAVKRLLEECMQGVMHLAVPLSAQVSAGNSWFDTK